MIEENLTPKPFSFNHLKHHLVFAKEYCKHKSFSLKTGSGIKNFIEGLKTIGDNITDIYTGSISVRNITEEITYNLKEHDFFEYNYYIKLFREKDYHKIRISDGSVWIIRLGQEKSNYIHIHPARAGKNTVRFAANAWKTALVCYFFKLRKTEFIFQLNAVNRLRVSYLELPPIKRLKQDSNINIAYSLLLKNN